MIHYNDEQSKHCYFKTEENTKKGGDKAHRNTVTNLSARKKNEGENYYLKLRINYCKAVHNF
jgi:hypothetical protein